MSHSPGAALGSVSAFTKYLSSVGASGGRLVKGAMGVEDIRTMEFAVLEMQAESKQG